MQDYNYYIAEYFNITGRPVSSLTVDEYIKFLSLGGSRPINDIHKSESTGISSVGNKTHELPVHTVHKVNTNESFGGYMESQEAGISSKLSLDEKIANAKKMMASIDG